MYSKCGKSNYHADVKEVFFLTGYVNSGYENYSSEYIHKKVSDSNKALNKRFKGKRERNGDEQKDKSANSYLSERNINFSRHVWAPWLLRRKHLVLILRN